MMPEARHDAQPPIPRLAQHPHGCTPGTPARGCMPGSRCRNHRGAQPQRAGEIIAEVLRQWA